MFLVPVSECHESRPSTHGEHYAALTPHRDETWIQKLVPAQGPQMRAEVRVGDGPVCFATAIDQSQSAVTVTTELPGTLTVPLKAPISFTKEVAGSAVCWMSLHHEV